MIFAFLQETHLTNNEHEKLKRDWVGKTFYSSFNSRSRGVAILFNRRLEVDILSVNKDDQGRLVKIKCDINKNHYTLISLCGPNIDDPQFFRELLLDLTQIHGQCMVGGDYNLVLDPLTDHSTKAPHFLTTAASTLREGMKDLSLVDAWRIKNPTQRDYSFYSKVHDSYSRIDLFLTSRTLCVKMVECSYLASTLSDHCPLKMSTENTPSPPGPFRWRLKPHLLNDQTFNEYIRNEIKTFLECNRDSASHSAIWESMLAYIRGMTISFAVQKRKKKHSKITRLEQTIHKLEKEHAQTKNTDITHLLTQKRLEYCNLCSHKAEADMARTRYHYYEKGEKTCKLLSWQIRKEENARTIHNIKNKEGEIISDPMSINKCFEEFYYDLYKSQGDIDPLLCGRFFDNCLVSKLSEENRRQLDAEITKDNKL